MFNLFYIWLLTFTKLITFSFSPSCLHLHERWIRIVIPSFSKGSRIVHADVSWWCRCHCVLTWVIRVGVLLLLLALEAAMGEICARRILNAWFHAHSLGVDGLKGVNLFITGVVICWRVESLLMFNGFFFKSHLYNIFVLNLLNVVWKYFLRKNLKSQKLWIAFTSKPFLKSILYCKLLTRSHLLELLRFRNPFVANSCSISLLPTK